MLIDVVIAAFIVFLLTFLWIVYTRAFGAEWIKMSKQVRKKMLSMLKLNKEDIFYDLGCGDGSLILEAAPKVKKAIGIEIDPIRFLIARARTSKHKNVEIIHGNLFRQLLNRATKVALFLSPEANRRLGQKLKQELRQKTLVTSYKWPLPDLKIVMHDRANRIYLQKA